MLSLKFLFGVVAFVALGSLERAEANFISPVSLNSQEWINYKTLYGKIYTSTTAEAYALSYYNYNKKLVTAHNTLADRGQRTYRLKMNQFSDMRLISFNALFPRTVQPVTSSATNPPAAPNAPDTFTFADSIGITIATEDQGTVCNSGWAYATAKAIEVLQAYQQGLTIPERLSAQNLIDCAGGSRGCTNQVSQTAFDFLTAVNRQTLHLTTSYPNRKDDAQQGMCTPPAGAVTGAGLVTYARINNADDATMMKYVAAGYPVVIEFDPTSFEFMHYASGIFVPPRTSGGSHFMLVTGYDRDAATGTNYWLVQNSFSANWGEEGRIRIIRNAATPLAKSALFPTELAP